MMNSSPHNITTVLIGSITDDKLLPIAAVCPSAKYSKSLDAIAVGPTSLYPLNFPVPIDDNLRESCEITPHQELLSI